MTKSNAQKTIIALDFANANDAVAMAKILSGTSVKFKVGMELFYAEGKAIIEKIGKHGEVFLDLKLHDIPETMAKTAAVLTELGVWMFNVHASAGPVALKRVRDAVNETTTKRALHEAPLLIGVTVLTSFKDLKHLSTTKSIPDLVFDLAQITHDVGLDGVVCSPHEVQKIKTLVGAIHESPLLCVTPGIRSATDPADDQNRTMTAQQAFAASSDYIVVGRPVTQAADPREALHNLFS